MTIEIAFWMLVGWLVLGLIGYAIGSFFGPILNLPLVSPGLR